MINMVGATLVVAQNIPLVVAQNNNIADVYDNQRATTRVAPTVVTKHLVGAQFNGDK